ncbi:MAG: hypothetical protein E7413_05315 [Ruminococcaceae bacterium]|nr:hypothetical protein [Oscillospiraceae bacterium]
MSSWEELFRGMDQGKVKSAMERAKALSENPTVQQAFARMDQKEIANMIRSLSEQDKNRLLKSLFQSKNKDFLEIIDRLK